jgi:hypothetical protein
MPAKKKTSRQAKQNRPSNRTIHEWREPFLVAYRSCAVIRIACEAAGVSRAVVAKERTENPKFEAAFREAQEEAVELLESEAWKRALGVNGRSVSDRMLEFMLKAAKPEKYARNRLELTGAKDAEPLRVESRNDVSLSECKLSALQSDPEAADALRTLALREAALLVEN